MLVTRAESGGCADGRIRRPGRSPCPCGALDTIALPDVLRLVAASATTGCCPSRAPEARAPSGSPPVPSWPPMPGQLGVCRAVKELVDAGLASVGSAMATNTGELVPPAIDWPSHLIDGHDDTSEPQPPATTPDLVRQLADLGPDAARAVAAAVTAETPEERDAALTEQHRTNKSLGRLLIESGAVTEADLVATLAAQIGLEFVDLADYQVDATGRPRSRTPWPAASRPSPSPTAVRCSSWPWPIRATSSPSTTSARSPGPSWPLARPSRRPSPARTASTAMSRTSPPSPSTRPPTTRTWPASGKSPRTPRSSSWPTC